MTYDDRIDAALLAIQKLVGTSADGAWGSNSQKALINSGKRLAYIHGSLPKQFGPLIQSQVDGFDAILNAVNKHNDNAAINPLYVAYMLATAWHETGIVTKINGKRQLLHTMQPVREMRQGKGRSYGQMVNINRQPYYGLNHIYYGRGYVQLTWIDNYAKMRELLGVDFINNPDLALDPKHAADIMIAGMLGGVFTGLSLNKCIRLGSYGEFVYCRRIINGTNEDDRIAKYAVKFLECLTVIQPL